jgi:hypothetical protein
MGNLALTLLASPLQLHESVAEHACPTSFGSTSPHWLGHKPQTGSHRTLSRAGWPDFVFAFHDDEEIGPRMLA